MQCFGERHFYNVHKEILFPVVNTAWLEQKEAINGYLSDKTLRISGDGRCDSLGFTPKYCTYTIINRDSNLVLDFQIKQVTKTGLSTTMEKAACAEVLSRVKNQFNIETFATDRHVQIETMMRSDFPDVNHQYDIFHVGKSLKKKIIEKGKKMNSEQLILWAKAISNHLWWCCTTSGGNIKLLKEKWVSILHHITGVHSWRLSELFNVCEHQSLTEDEQKRKA